MNGRFYSSKRNTSLPWSASRIRLRSRQNNSDVKLAQSWSQRRGLMRRWSSPAFQRQNQCFKTAKFLYLGRNDQLASIHHVPKHQWLHQCFPNWHQSRFFTQQRLTLSKSQQSSDSNWKSDLELANLSNERFRDLLSEASRYAIHSVEALDFESSVTSAKGRNTRLVDRPKYQFDFELWTILMRYRMRAYGDEGIITVWRFLTRRDRARLLPADWTTEDYFWNIFVSLGLKDHEFLEKIAEHVKRLWQQRKMRRPTLYVEVVGGLLKSENSAAAPVFSGKMHPGVSITSEELVELFVEACGSVDPNASERFWLICDSVPNHKIYGKVISILCEQERVAEAMATHTHLIRRHDYPASFEEIEPLVRRIARDGLDMSAFIRPLKEADVSFSGRIQRLHESVKETTFGISREDIDLATNKTFGVRRAKISDAFAARFFATRSFSFQFALSGLHMLGLDEVGPLSLREIALQASTATLMQQRLAKLDSMEIDTGSSAYSRVIRKLVREQEDSLLTDVITCDQHPDVFEDQQVQFQLLTEYYQAKDWRQFNRTVAILDIWGDMRQHAPNGMLRRALLRKDWPEVAKIAARLHQENTLISTANIILMYQSILRPRMPTKRVPVRKAGFQDLLCVITLWQKCLMSGSEIPSNAWREPLRRLGMMGRWNDLAKACHWLCSFYSQTDIACAGDQSIANPAILPMAPGSTKRGHLLIESILNEILSPALQRAIVEWGFLAGLKSRKVAPRIEVNHLKQGRVLDEAPWICGVEFLCRLQRQYGVRLHEAAIQAACQERLRQLFSIRGRSKLRYNREARAMNKSKLQYYVSWINLVYGQVLLDPHDFRTMLSIYRRRRAKRPSSFRALRSFSKPIIRRQNDASRHREMNKDETSLDDIVMYRDLFHASWEDYQPPPQNDKK